MLGKPVASIRVASTEPVAKLVVRLNEVTPDGVSWSVSYGVLNLTHRDGHEKPSALEPGRHYDVDVPCYFTAHRFKKGNRIRVAISESIWPMLWPSPKPVRLDITAGASRLSLPIRPDDGRSPSMPIGLLRDRVQRRVEADPADFSNQSVTQAGPDAEGRVMLHKRLRDEPETLADIGTRMSGGSDWYHVDQGGRSEQRRMAAGMVQPSRARGMGHGTSIDARAHLDPGAFPYEGVDPRDRGREGRIRAALGSRHRARSSVEGVCSTGRPPPARVNRRACSARPPAKSRVRRFTGRAAGGGTRRAGADPCRACTRRSRAGRRIRPEQVGVEHLARDRRRGRCAESAVLHQHRERDLGVVDGREGDEPGVVALALIGILTSGLCVFRLLDREHLSRAGFPAIFILSPRCRTHKRCRPAGYGADHAVVHHVPLRVGSESDRLQELSASAG